MIWVFRAIQTSINKTFRKCRLRISHARTAGNGLCLLHFLLGLFLLSLNFAAHLILIPHTQLLRHLHLLNLPFFLRSLLRLLHNLPIRLRTNTTFPPRRILRYLLPLTSTTLHTSKLTLHVRLHETPQRNQRRADSPRWHPGLFMMATNAQAYFAVYFEAPAGCEEAEGGRAEWVGRW